MRRGIDHSPGRATRSRGSPGAASRFRRELRDARGSHDALTSARAPNCPIRIWFSDPRSRGPTMKLFLFAVAALSWGCLTQPSQAASCPPDPVAASSEVWKLGSLYGCDEVTRTHPCGRKIACTPGSAHRSAPRVCDWL